MMTVRILMPGIADIRTLIFSTISPRLGLVKVLIHIFDNLILKSKAKSFNTKDTKSTKEH